MGANLIAWLLTGVVTARVLGPYNKGTLSTLSFIGDTVLFYVCSLGLGEALPVVRGQHGASLHRLVSASLLPSLVASAGGVAMLFWIVIPADWGQILDVVAIQALVLVMTVYVHLFYGALNTLERFAATTRIIIARSAITASLTTVFLLVLDLGLLGAVLAGAAGMATALLLSAKRVHDEGLSLRPSWDLELLGRTLPIGLGLQASYVLMALSQRLDQAIVYSLSGPAPAGQYAVALTVTQVIGLAPAALSTGSFPRLARTDPGDVEQLTSSIVRMGLAVTLVVSGVVAISVPIMIPFIFGSPYSAAVVPSLILVPGVVFWSAQWLLARAAAARGRTRVLVASFGLSVVVMVGLDLWLVPTHGITGAAVASLIASLVGAIYCVHDYLRTFGGPAIHQLLPGRAEMSLMVGWVSWTFDRLRRRAR